MTNLTHIVAGVTLAAYFFYWAVIAAAPDHTARGKWILAVWVLPLILAAMVLWG